MGVIPVLQAMQFMQERACGRGGSQEEHELCAHLNVLELLRPEDELEDLLVAGDCGAASALTK